MLAHVPVVSQHTHWHMGGYFGQLPQDVVKSPAIDRITTFIWEYQYQISLPQLRLQMTVHSFLKYLCFPVFMTGNPEVQYLASKCRELRRDSKQILKHRHTFF